MLVVLMLCITLSIVWSVDGALTSKRVLTFIANTLIAVYLVLDRDFKWLLGVLSWCMLILLLGSALTVLLLPELGMIPDEQGGGRGVNGLFVHKNPLGEAIVLSLIIFFAAFRTRAVAPLISVGGFVIALLLLLPAGSAASLAVAILVLMIQAWFSISRLPLRQRLVLLAFASALGLLVLGAIILNLEAVLAAFGRDATLTGRTDIWAYAWQMSEKRPLLGYGYGIFWEVDAYAQYIKDTFKWSIASAHNGYLDIMLGLGWLGLALAVAFMGTMAFRLIARSRDLEPGVLVFALPTLVYTIAFNLLEAKMFNPRGLGWLVVVIAFLLLTPRLRAIRAVGR
jgi:O-antigen ligase